MTLRTPHAPRRRQQRGISLFGLMFWAIVVAFVGYIAVVVFPTVLEYFTIQRTVNRIVMDSPTTVAEVRAAFERQKAVEYSITSIGSSDLDITKQNDRLVIDFAYEKEIPIVGPVYLLIKYEGRGQQ